MMPPSHQWGVAAHSEFPPLGAGNSPTQAQEGLQPTNGGQAVGAMAQAMPYSGFVVALKQWGEGKEGFIMHELKWQGGITSDTQKIKQVQDVVGGLQDFQTYLFIKPGSAFVTILHYPMKFVAISKATQNLQGCFVSFVGDRMLTNDLTLLILTQKKRGNGRQK